jgi:hypothetical protein
VKGKAQLALALSMLLLMASAFSAEAGRPNPTVTGGSWSYCQVGVTGQWAITASGLEASHVGKYDLVMVLTPGGPVSARTIQKKPTITLEWLPGTVSADPTLVPGDSYTATIVLDPGTGDTIGTPELFQFYAGVPKNCPLSQ